MREREQSSSFGQLDPRSWTIVELINPPLCWSTFWLGFCHLQANRSYPVYLVTLWPPMAMPAGYSYCRCLPHQPHDACTTYPFRLTLLWTHVRRVSWAPGRVIWLKSCILSGADSNHTGMARGRYIRFQSQNHLVWNPAHFLSGCPTWAKQLILEMTLHTS